MTDMATTTATTARRMWAHANVSPQQRLHLNRLAARGQAWHRANPTFAAGRPATRKAAGK